MSRLKILLITTAVFLLALALYTGSISNRRKAEETFSSLSASFIDTSLGYNINYTAQFTFNTTITNHGPLPVSFPNLKSTILVAGKPTLAKTYGSVTLGVGESRSLNVTNGVLNVSDVDESIYRSMKAVSLELEVVFSGVAEAGGTTRNVTFTGKFTTGSLHTPGDMSMLRSNVVGPLNTQTFPRYDLEYVSLVGKLASTRFSPSLSFTGTVFNDTIDVLTLITNNTYLDNYVILDYYSHLPVRYDSSDYSGLRSLDTVYVTGAWFYYQSWDGNQYKVLIPTEVSSSRIVDPFDQARQYIISKIGEVNYDRSFFEPEVIKYTDRDLGNSSYEVTFLYWVWGGDINREFTISVYLDSNKTVTHANGIPPVDNLAPYRVDAHEAKLLAKAAGLVEGPYHLQSDMVYWPFADNGSNPIWAGRYIWEVTSWIDPPESNPRRLSMAKVDPSTGEVYVIETGEGMGYIVSKVGFH